MIQSDTLAKSLIGFLPRQRWFGAKDREIVDVTLERAEPLIDDWPQLTMSIVRVHFSDGDDELYSIAVGSRPMGETAPFLEGVAEGVIGEVDTDKGPGYAYDAVRDPELAKKLIGIATPALGEPETIWPVTGEQSNTSIVFDDAYIVKMFRKISAEPNLDIEIHEGLEAHGFEHVAETIAVWRSDPYDLGVVRRYLTGGSDGWALALTSIRDLFDARGDPAKAGGDFGAEAFRLGEMTGRMHLALAEAFGRQEGDPARWADLMERQLQSIQGVDIDKDGAAEIFDDLREIESSGSSIRVHGDYHLGQVMRTDAGWFVLDFEGEPARARQEREVATSPLKDVSGMLRSLQYAVNHAMTQGDEILAGVARAWEERNRESFLEGYVGVAHDGHIVPADLTSFRILLRAFELDKALYEIRYEQANRPDWVHIPQMAVERLIQAARKEYGSSDNGGGPSI